MVNWEDEMKPWLQSQPTPGESFFKIVKKLDKGFLKAAGGD